MPASSAQRTAATCASGAPSIISRAPVPQPNPISETCSPVAPSERVFTDGDLISPAAHCLVAAGPAVCLRVGLDETVDQAGHFDRLFGEDEVTGVVDEVHFRTVVGFADDLHRA